jgi:four helix bundle protein
MTTCQNLEAWKKAMALVKDVYLNIQGYPKEELFALSQQTKRAAVSIPANIAEGAGRNYKKDSIQFFHIARGSLYELETLLQIASMLNYLNYEQYNTLNEKIVECLRLLNGLISYFEKSELR